MFTKEINLVTLYGYLLAAGIILFVVWFLLGAGKKLWPIFGAAIAAFVGAIIGFNIGNIEFCIVLALVVYAIFAIKPIRSFLFDTFKKGAITIAVILGILILLGIF